MVNESPAMRHRIPAGRLLCHCLGPEKTSTPGRDTAEIAINKNQATKDYNIIKMELFTTFGRRSILEFHQWYYLQNWPDISGISFLNSGFYMPQDGFGHVQELTSAVLVAAMVLASLRYF